MEALCSFKTSEHLTAKWNRNARDDYHLKTTTVKT
jgi:hypothetical protein